MNAYRLTAHHVEIVVEANIPVGESHHDITDRVEWKALVYARTLNDAKSLFWRYLTDQGDTVEYTQITGNLLRSGVKHKSAVDDHPPEQWWKHRYWQLVGEQEGWQKQ